MASTLEMLLNQLAAQNGGGPGLPPSAQSVPIPLIAPGQPNVPEYGGPSQVTEPPVAPLDPRIIQQYLAAQGPAPTPPAPLSRGQRVANALMGFSAGMEGRGGEFLRQLQEPQRIYQAQLENYNDRRSNLALRGQEAQMRDVERRTERAQRLSDQQFEAEFQRESRRLNLSDDEQKMRLQQAFTLERDARRARQQETQALERERREKQDRAKQIENQYFGLSKNRALSRELGEYWASLKDSLSPAAARLDAQLQGVGQARMQRAAGAGGGGRAGSAAQKAKDNFDAAKQAVISAVQRGDVRAERLLRRKLDAAVGQLARFPGQIEYGGGEWPYAKLIGAQQPGQQSGQRAAAKAKLMSAGFGDAEAEQELNRLGIR